jgi:hypothetical protein
MTGGCFTVQNKLQSAGYSNSGFLVFLDFTGADDRT